MRRWVALALLALAACGRVSAPSNGGGAPAPSNTAGATGSPTPSAPMPMPMPMDQNMTMSTPPDEAQAGGPRDRFIVCPGNPRCPPAGNPPKTRPD